MRCKHCGSTETKQVKIPLTDNYYSEIIHSPDCILVKQRYIWEKEVDKHGNR